MKTISHTDALYRVLVSGDIIAGTDRQMVVRKLSRLFGIPAERVEDLLDGQPSVIKHNLPKHRAYQYLRTISNAGAACYIDRQTPSGPEETVQMPAFDEREFDSMPATLEIDDFEFDSLDKVRRFVRQKKEFSEFRRAREEVQEKTRRNSDIVITGLLVGLVLLLVLVVVLLIF